MVLIGGLGGLGGALPILDGGLGGLGGKLAGSDGPFIEDAGVDGGGGLQRIDEERAPAPMPNTGTNEWYDMLASDLSADHQKTGTVCALDPAQGT